MWVRLGRWEGKGRSVGRAAGVGSSCEDGGTGGAQATLWAGTEGDAYCPVLFFLLLCNKALTKRNLGEERVYLPDTSMSLRNSGKD